MFYKYVHSPTDLHRFLENKRLFTILTDHGGEKRRLANLLRNGWLIHPLTYPEVLMYISNVLNKSFITKIAFKSQHLIVTQSGK